MATVGETGPAGQMHLSEGATHPPFGGAAWRHVFDAKRANKQAMAFFGGDAFHCQRQQCLPKTVSKVTFQSVIRPDAEHGADGWLHG